MKPHPLRAVPVFWISACAAALAAAGSLRAEVIASDSASDPAYADGWQALNGVEPRETGTDNGGYGFLPWDFEADRGLPRQRRPVPVRRRQALAP